jgi:hypothetical protein
VTRRSNVDGIGCYRATPAAGARPRSAVGAGQPSISQGDAQCSSGWPSLARHAQALRQVKLGLRAVQTLRGAGRLVRAARNAGELGLTDNWQHMIDSTTIRGTLRQRALKGDS